MKFRTGYDGKFKEVSKRSGLQCKDVSLTVQSEKDNCDINVIMRRFGQTGQLPAGARLPPLTGDFSECVNDYGTALRMVRAAQEAFAALPAKVRHRFHQSPEAFVAFCSDPANIEEVRKLGLAPTPEVNDGEGNAVPSVNRGSSGGSAVARGSRDSAGGQGARGRAPEPAGGERLSADAAGVVDESSEV